MATLGITGGTGFVGAKLVEAALAAGHDVRALARQDQPAQSRLNWVRGDLADARALGEMCRDADAVIHVAGVINARSPADFDAGNVAGTRAVLAMAANVPRFVHVSSLAAREPQVSAYGRSKADADALVRALRPDAVIVRPPAVYGPGDRETATFFRLVARGIAPLPSDGRLSIVEVSDLARALLALAATDAGAGQLFEIDDGTEGGMTHREFAALIAAAVGTKPLTFTIPRPLLTLGAALDTAAARMRGTLPALSFDRARYLAHPDWTADSGPLRALGIWKPEVPAAEGIAATAAWYRAAGWL